MSLYLNIATSTVVLHNKIANVNKNLYIIVSYRITKYIYSYILHYKW